MGGGGEARASICRAAGWPGRACPGWEARRETRRDGHGRCAAEEGDDQWVPLVSGGERALCAGQADCGARGAGPAREGGNGGALLGCAGRAGVWALD